MRNKRTIDKLNRIFFGLLAIAGVMSIFYIAPSLLRSHKNALQSLLPQQQEKQDLFGAHHYTLDNGLKLVVIPNHRAPVIHHMVWYKTGAADEPAGQSGIAHFLEHLLFKGTPRHPDGTFSTTIKQLGGRDNAFTSQDVTVYHQTIAAEHLQTVMAMEADRMVNLQITPDNVASERDVILEERSQRIDNSPVSQFFEHMRAVHFINHPYGTPVIGWRHEMEQLSYDMALNFYQKYYRPDNAAVIVTGDVSGDEAYKAANATYGMLPAKQNPPTSNSWTQSPPLYGSNNITHSDERIKQAKIYMLFTVPSHAQDKKSALALEILANRLGGGSTSRLYNILVREEKLSSYASASYSKDARGPSEFWISADAISNDATDTIINLINAELMSIAQNGINKAELQTAKNKALDSAILSQDSLANPAMIYGMRMLTGANIQDIEQWHHDIQAITEKDIQSVAKQFLTDKENASFRKTIGILRPHSAANKQSPKTNKPSAPLSANKEG